jgi:DNA-binding CsgD family transcriptional regulator
MKGMRPRHAGALDFLEAVYAWEADDDAWLAGLIQATIKVCGRPRWACAYEYDVSQPGRFEMGPMQSWNTPAPVRAGLIERLRANGPAMARIYRTEKFGYGGDLRGFNSADNRFLARTNTADFFGVNGHDGGGRGCFIGLGVARPDLSRDEATLIERLSAHLASAYRCRTRLRAGPGRALDDAEAVLSPDGRILEARDNADDPQAREALSDAGRRLARLRRRARHPDALTPWTPRVATRWTLVEVTAGRRERYLVARENLAPVPGLEALTQREQQVVASAAGGKSNKEIAYELGISFATTRVLLSRAYARLGVHTRRELLQLPDIRALRGEPG